MFGFELVLDLDPEGNIPINDERKEGAAVLIHRSGHIPNFFIDYNDVKPGN